MSTKLSRLVIGAASILTFLPFLSLTAHAAGDPGLSIVIKPLSRDGEVHALEVRQELTAGAPADGRYLTFTAPLAVFGVRAIADKIEGLSVTDAGGEVPLRVTTDPKPQGYDKAYRHWQATRPTVLPVSVRYRIPTQPASEQGGPPFGMRASGRGVAGLALGFLLLPENATSSATRVGWDLSELPAGSVGAITAGAGTAIVAGLPQEVLSQWMLAGPASVFNSRRSPGFQAYVLGRQPFDVDATIDWADRGYAYLAKSLKYLGTPEYRMFFRGLEVPSFATGSARPEGGGALITTGPTMGDQKMSEFRNTLFHEMTHQWVGDLSGAGAWFVEGLTTYLSAVMPCEAGLEEARFCADGVNKWARYYYGGVARNWSLARIEATADDEDVRVAPYGRGMLYFALLNSQLLAKSQGRTRLQDVLAPLFEARTRGVRLDEAAWEVMLLRELGQPAVDEFRASVIEGTKTIVPPADAFGPCLGRVRAGVDGYEWQPVPCGSQAINQGDESSQQAGNISQP